MKKNYEEKYNQLKKDIQELKTEKIELDKVQDGENSIKERITSFRKLFECKEPLTEFDKDVFKIVVEEVIIGGHKEDGVFINSVDWNFQKMCWGIQY